MYNKREVLFYIIDIILQFLNYDEQLFIVRDGRLYRDSQFYIKECFVHNSLVYSIDLFFFRFHFFLSTMSACLTIILCISYR
jgi:hypothetical protein